MDNQALSQQPFLTFFDSDTAEYDVIVDQSSSAPNLKEATWGALQPLFPLIADKIGPDEFSLILSASPLPESFIEEWKALQDKKAQQPPPPDPEMMKVQAMQQAKQAELQMRQQESQVQMQMDQQNAQLQLQIEQQKAAAEIQLEREKATAQLQLEDEKMQQQFQLEQVKLQHQMELERMKAKLQGEIAMHTAEINAQNASDQMQGDN